MLKELTRTRRSGGNVSLEIVTVTPEIAKAWIDRNASNRKLSRRHVSRFSRDMGTKKWLMTGETIKFDADGTLIDGQHRLSACVTSGKPFETIVVYGLNPAAKNVIDTGKLRSGSDVLAMAGHKNTSAIASALRILVNEKTGEGDRFAVTHTELLDALKRHPKLPLWVPLPGSVPRGISIPMVGYVAYIGANILGKKERATAMLTVLKSGAPDYEGDPIHRYREHIIRSRDERLGDLRARNTVAWTFRHCWNLFAKRQPIERFVWQKEPVEIIGLDKKDL